MTLETLKDCTKKDLVRMARDRGITGWHAMRKDQLVQVLASMVKVSSASKRRAASATTKSSTTASKTKTKTIAKAPSPKSPGLTKPAPSKGTVDRRKRKVAAKTPAASSSALAEESEGSTRLNHGCAKDRIIVSVRDPFWLHTYWELSRATLGRAQAAMGQDWHTARPILRVMDVTSEDTTANAERVVRDISIHGGVNNWYIDVNDPPRSYRIDIGYLSRQNKFFVLARSNVVTTPRAGCADALDEHWASVDERYQRIYSQSLNGGAVSTDLQEVFEQQLRRPMNPLNLTSLGTGALHPGTGSRGFHFEIDAELVVFGTTEPNAKVTMQGEPVKIRPDGSFSVRFQLPDNRQIIPAVSSSPDGIEERTIVLAVERNTKELEPMIHDGNEL